MISPDPAARAGAVDDAAARLFRIIESSYESVALLLKEVEETAIDVGENLRRDQLRFQLATSARRLGDLRALRS